MKKPRVKKRTYSTYEYMRCFFPNFISSTLLTELGSLVELSTVAEKFSSLKLLLIFFSLK